MSQQVQLRFFCILRGHRVLIMMSDWIMHKHGHKLFHDDRALALWHENVTSFIEAASLAGASEPSNLSVESQQSQATLDWQGPINYMGPGLVYEMRDKWAPEIDSAHPAIGGRSSYDLSTGEVTDSQKETPELSGVSATLLSKVTSYCFLQHSTHSLRRSQDPLPSSSDLPSFRTGSSWCKAARCVNTWDQRKQEEKCVVFCAVDRRLSQRGVLQNTDRALLQTVLCQGTLCLVRLASSICAHPS